MIKSNQYESDENREVRSLLCANFQLGDRLFHCFNLTIASKKQLKANLKHYLEFEMYEHAAEIRDEIKRRKKHNLK